jgi:hypothetical protein
MRWGHIPDGDSLFRHSIDPLSFKRGRFAQEKWVKLYDQADGFLASLTWERYVPTRELLHGYGCRLAFRMNEKDRTGGKFKDKNRRVYCGAYQVKGRAIRALAAADGLDEILSADVVHHVEDGEIAHTDLKIVLRPDVGLNVEGTKTAILDRLWNACSGPLKHTCDCDKDIAVHPSSSLITPPGGEYSDDRSYSLRLWYVIRFRICNWLWRNFFQHDDL